ncbi:hypothetical protein GH714_035568 [Hevea brasiliensis]|uniref:Uncharacterized protein n=1 Tax=Hevea brasiliensis TaxID=3981 RepID=A0A6A6KRZ6_HEVBR|nr:hypothetical protein GH714_035568 [Hevea brasiliensis]
MPLNSKRSLSSAIFLVAGTTVGAGILAIPAVTQEAGFLASAVACIVATGLLIAEVNVNTMCELGSVRWCILGVNGQENSGNGWSSNCCIHFRSAAAVAISVIVVIIQRFIGAVNGVLVFGIIISFTALAAVASGEVQPDALLKANFEAVPMSIPIIALSFVYQNVVPVLCTNLEGNISKVR